MSNQNYVKSLSILGENTNLFSQGNKYIIPYNPHKGITPPGDALTIMADFLAPIHNKLRQLSFSILHQFIQLFASIFHLIFSSSPNHISLPRHSKSIHKKSTIVSRDNALIIYFNF